MNAAILAFVALGVSLQQIVKKEYNNRVGGAFTFSAVSAACSLIFYFITAKGKPNFTDEIIIYAFAFAIAYSCALVGSFLAIKHGPLSVSSLVFQYSLLIPTFFGLFAYHEEIKASLFIGLFLLFTSILLINKKNRDKNTAISPKWFAFVLLGFIGNGLCSCIQKVQQHDFDGKYKSEFMIIAITVSSLVLLGISLFAEKSNVTVSLKKGFLLMAICGIANGGVNFGTMVLTNTMPASVMFPVISAGSVVVTCTVSIIVYKERLTVTQLLGILLGIAAIIAMNL